MDFKPFDKVLVRDGIDQSWEIDLFLQFDTAGNYVYHCLENYWRMCIPYEGNESLLGTTKNPARGISDVPDRLDKLRELSKDWPNDSLKRQAKLVIDRNE